MRCTAPDQVGSPVGGPDAAAGGNGRLIQVHLMMTLRQALPLHVSLFGTLLLPPNQPRLRLELVQLMPTGPPSASLVTLVVHANRSRPFVERGVQRKADEIRRRRLQHSGAKLFIHGMKLFAKRARLDKSASRPLA